MHTHTQIFFVCYQNSGNSFVYYTNRNTIFFSELNPLTIYRLFVLFFSNYCFFNELTIFAVKLLSTLITYKHKSLLLFAIAYIFIWIYFFFRCFMQWKKHHQQHDDDDKKKTFQMNIENIPKVDNHPCFYVS
jgi:hypothetical protein